MIVIFTIFLIILIIINKNFKEFFIYRMKPNKVFGYNDNILRNILYGEADSISVELRYDEFNKLLKDITNLNIIAKNKEEAINKIILNLNKLNNYDKFSIEKTQYRLVDSKVIEDYKNSLIFNMSIDRKYKAYYYTIQVKILNNKITKLTIIGLSPNQNIKLKKPYNLNEKINLNDVYNSKILTNVDYNDNLIKDKLTIRNKDYLEQQGQCFEKSALTKTHCISDNNGKRGIWDIPCFEDNDCPFFKKNKNYKNKRGGCIYGYCELPINVERIGFTTFKGEPLCYNCKNKNCKGIYCNLCCKQQKNKKKYPNLKSPDYMFNNDKFDRDLQKLSSNLIY